jgi:hypothetical protein
MRWRNLKDQGNAMEDGNKIVPSSELFLFRREASKKKKIKNTFYDRKIALEFVS